MYLSKFQSMMTFNNMLILGSIIVFIVISVIFYNYYISPSAKPVYTANNEEGNNVSGQGQGQGQSAELMFFFADWCPHCKTAKPIWNEMKNEYENKPINGYNVIFTELDCSEESPEVEKLMNKYNIEGYPTIKLIKDGQIIEYDAKPTKENLQKFLTTVL